MKKFIKSFQFPLLIVAIAVILIIIRGFSSPDQKKLEVLKQPIDKFSYEIIQTFPHDKKAFTQGLQYHNGFLYESTGKYGRSVLRKVKLETGEVLEEISLENKYFGEGITIIEDKIFQLTWKSNRGFVYDLNSFEIIKEFRYQTEGWGLTNDDNNLIMSDGTDTIYFYSIEDLSIIRTIPVKINGVALDNINELEYINGKIYANIWQTDLIAIIDPNTGVVTGEINLAGLLSEEETFEADVLNGIAYDPENNRLFVTGKSWPYLFEIEMVKL